MQYQIVYQSRTGNTEKIAMALADIFPANSCRLVDISHAKPSDDADVFLVGFGVSYDSCPYALLEWLEGQAGKTILLFGTGGLCASESYKQRIEQCVRPFLPQVSRYLGMCLVPGSWSETAFYYFRDRLHLDSDQLQHLYQQTLEHPSEADIQKVCEFVRERLDLTEGE